MEESIQYKVKLVYTCREKLYFNNDNFYLKCYIQFQLIF